LTNATPSMIVLTGRRTAKRIGFIAQTPTFFAASDRPKVLIKFLYTRSHHEDGSRYDDWRRKTAAAKLGSSRAGKPFMAWRKGVSCGQQRSGRSAGARGESDTLCGGVICESVSEGAEARRMPGNQHNSRSSSSDSGSSSSIETMIGSDDGVVALIATP